MTEESEGKFNSEEDIIKHNQVAKKHGNGWIVCRSQKRPGLLYDFNTITGEAVWRDPEKKVDHSAIVDKNKVHFNCHEPTDPPVDSKHYQHLNATTTLSSSAPKIYNKQIINNQFPAKPFTMDPFGNAACVPYGFLNHNNAIGMSTPQVWVTAPAPPVLIGPSVTALNQLPTIYGGLENIHLQNTSVTLNNRFQVLKHMNHERPIGSDTLDGDGPENLTLNNRFQVLKHMKHERPIGSDTLDGGGPETFANYIHMRPRLDRNFGNRHLNKQNDLRNLLSSRKRQDLQNNAEDNAETKDDVSLRVIEDAAARVTVDDLNPDDGDEWLEAHTEGEGTKLDIDVGGIWDLADSGASRDCWYIIPTTRALLNNMRFLTSLVISDERLRLVAARDVVRTLRSAAFSADGRLADSASRARTFVIRQMSKIPNSLKDAANVTACRKLIGPNTHVVHLIDEKDAPNKEFINGLQITALNLKRHFESTVNSKPKPLSKVQNIMENIKIVVRNDEPKRETDSILRCNTTGSTITQSAGTERTELKNQDMKIIDKTGFKETQIQTDLLTTPPRKSTANACVQTDFDFTLTQSEMKPKEINIAQVANTVEASNESTTKVPTRKIRLKRQQSTNTGINSDEKKTFRWRKRKDTGLTSSERPSQAGNSNKSCSRGSSPPPSSTSDLLAQQNDNALDCGHSDFSVQAKIVDESSMSAVISNSIDSETMFKINKEAILNESKIDLKEEIVTYEITTVCMQDRLSMRCDEWVSRYVQIMEEVLSQVLLLDPPFIDSTLPPPWTLHEATVCVKRKLKNRTIIVDASDKLDDFLMKIKYDRGNIETRISPADFMLMYSYGVNLVNKLQLVLDNCEDLHIASQNLSNLLSDIREPNIDESYDMDNLNTDEPVNYSPNISEIVTNTSTSDVRDYTAPTTNKSPQKKRKNVSCDNSPARYSLRSSRSAEKNKVEEKTESVSRENKDYTLFATLGLRKNNFVPGKCIAKTIFNPTSQEPLTPPATEAQNSAQNVQENNGAKLEPKIIRNFSICPEMENKLMGTNVDNTEDSEKDADYACSADDYGVNDYTIYNYTDGDYAADNYTTNDYIDFEGDENANAILDAGNDDTENDILRTTAMDVGQNYERTNPTDLNANRILKLVVHITTYKYRRWLAELHKFCEDTNTVLKSKDYSLSEYQINVMEKTKTVSEHAKNVCNRLKSILNRDPCVTSDRFRGLMKEYGIQDFDMNDAQLGEYRVIIEKYLELAEQLSICVTRLADTVRAK